MIQPWLLPLIGPLQRFLTPTSFSRKAQGPVSIWTSAGVCGLGRGKIASTTQSTCSGALIRSRFSAFMLARLSLMKTTGVPASLRSKTFSIPGVSGLSHSVEELLSSTRSPSPASGMWRLWFLCRTLYHGN